MTEPEAIAINHAACSLWLFKNGLKEKLAFAHLDRFRACSMAQLQTATEIVEAVNANAPLIGGSRTMICTVAANALPELIAYAATLPCNAPDNGM